MTAVAIAPLGRTEVLQWLAPAPVWDDLSVGAGASGLARPWIAELTRDSFMDDVTAMLAGTVGTPADLATLEPEARAGGGSTGPYRLFQPLSERYYLVCATLACRRPGIPDHAVDATAGEATTFVVRRIAADGSEHAYVPATGGGDWVAATGADLVAGEEQHPMHPMPVAPYSTGGTTAALGLDRDTGIGRTVFVGYVPVAIGEQTLRPMPDPAGALAALRAHPPAGLVVPDPILSWLFARVIDPWVRLAPPKPQPPNGAYGSLFLLLELGDWLDEHLRPVHDAIKNGSSLTGAYDALLDGLDGISVPLTGGGSVSLRQAIKDTLPYRALLDGDDIAGPPAGYDLRNASNLGTWLGSTPTAGSLAHLAQAALAVAPVDAELPPELAGMIKERPAPVAGSPTGSGQTYVIRTVFEHAPCRPVLSAPTHDFELARALDPDAPARQILLQMPDLNSLRKAKRGVAIETPPSLQRMLARVTPEMMKGDPPGADPGLQLGWICSFSLQIIFLVAFIVMFIFLILLNIVFWWMPFLKICFPIPVPPSSSNGPTP